MEHFKILVVDDDTVIRKSIVSYLKEFHNAGYSLTLDDVDSCEKAITLLTDKSYDLAIIDINMPVENGFELVQKLKTISPKTKLAMITGYPIEYYLKYAKTLGIFNIIAKTAPFNFEELSHTLNGLLQPDKYLLGINNYLEDNVDTATKLISTYNHLLELQNTVKGIMETLSIKEKELISVAVLEAITNAIYYQGEPTPDLREKPISDLSSNEEVEVKYGYDNDKFAVAVRDKAGKLKAEDVFFWMDRNFSGAGLLDTHGRGFYLMHCIVDRLIINIKPGSLTEIIFIVYYNTDFKGYKSIHVNKL